MDKDNDLVFHFKFSKIVGIMTITLKRPIYARENRDVTFGTPGGVEIADFSDGAPLEFIQWLTRVSTSIYFISPQSPTSLFTGKGGSADA